MPGKTYSISQVVTWSMADLAATMARRVSVETGRVGSSGLIEITGGLTAASRLITSGREALRDGARIRITGEDTSLGLSTTPRPNRESP